MLHTPRVLACAAGLVGCVPDNPDTDSSGSTSGGSTSATADESTGPPPTTTFDVVCSPGQQRCLDDTAREVCSPTGLEWQQVACTKYQRCSETGAPTVAACLGPCEDPVESSLGCEFLAIRMRSSNTEDPEEVSDALIVGNTDREKTAEVRLYFTPNYFNVEEPQGDPVVLQPGETVQFDLSNETLPGASAFRTGGVYHVVSDYPVAAYLHSPLSNASSNDASLLLPIQALGTDYVIASYPPYAIAEGQPGYDKDRSYGRPSYFVVIATEDDTQITWTPPNPTFGNGANMEPVAAGQTSDPLTLQRFDTVQIGAASEDLPDLIKHDVSGTVLHATKPVLVMGATGCAAVPFGSDTCNHLQEQLLPLQYWGARYVAAHPPLRGDEHHYWRVYAGEDNVTIITDPPVPGHETIPLARLGDFADVLVPHGQNFTFQSSGSRAFMPVQYLAGATEAGGRGDPSMVQAIAIEQQLARYVFVTGRGYDENYAQVIRKFAGPEVHLDDVPVTGYALLNVGDQLQYEIATVLLTGDDDAVHIAESDEPFALNVVGYAAATSAYAYPGGTALKVINL